MKKKNILLVLPYSKAYQITPDIGLGYLGSVLRKNGHRVNIIDCVNKGLDNDDLLSHIKNGRYDAVGFKVFTKDLNSVREAAQRIKEFNKNIITIAGGPHPSCSPKQTLEYIKDLDFTIFGEGENALTALIENTQESPDMSDKLSRVNNLAWRNKGDIILNEKEICEDLDNLPFPAWDLLNPNEYPPAPQGFMLKSFPTAPIMATRGCPFDCSFCCGKLITGKKLRYRSPDNLINEIRYLHDNFGVSEVHFEDDNFTMRKDYVLEVCSKINQLPFKLYWALPQGVRLSTLDRELLEEMKNAGCYSFSLGIESGSQNVLNSMKKMQTLDGVYEKVKLINDVGINTMGFFILGYPTETVKDAEETISFSQKLPLTYASFNIFKPYPGTPIYDELKTQGKLGNLDWNTFDYDKVSWSSGFMNPEEVKSLQKKATLSFYLRPKILFKFLSSIRTFTQIKFLMQRIFSVVMQKG